MPAPATGTAAAPTPTSSGTLALPAAFAGTSGQPAGPPALVRVLDVRPKPLGRGPILFALISLFVVVAAGTAYLVHRLNTPPELTPEETISGFLSAVFVAEDANRVGALVCSSWSGQDAVARTTKEIEPGAHVSWDQIRIVSTTETEANGTARIGQRLPDDTRPSIFKQWRFQLKKEKGWRVCEARPIGS